MRSLAHRSWCAENPGTGSNERLEFLGDAVLGLVVTDHLYRTYPDMPEGELAKVRASVVNSAALAELAAELDIGEPLLLGKGEDQSGGRQKPSILADAMEALIGAVYLDQGWSASETMVMRLLGRPHRVGGGGTGRPGLQDPSARAVRTCLRSASRLRRDRRGPGPRQAVPRGRARPGPARGRGTGPIQEASRAGCGPGGVGDAAGRRGPRPVGRIRPGGSRMPELPEVETIRRDIEKEFVNKRIKKVEVTGPAIRSPPPRRQGVRRPDRGPQADRHPPSGEVPALEARQRRRPGRSSRHERPVAARQPQGRAAGKHTHVVLSFVGAPQLRFVDPRTFGELFVTAPDRLEEEVPELAHLGFDPIDEQMAWTRFGDLLAARKTKLKPLLMDQRFVAGIGNMYADEILFAPDCDTIAAPTRLTPQEIRRLYRARRRDPAGRHQAPRFLVGR